MPNKLSQFWQELKRRKVTRVITVYAAASFVILQLVEILAPSLRLPEWTMNLILVLLIVGFIIAVILSWIYDIHPEGGIVKTEPASKASERAAPSSNRWKIASYISFVVIVGLIVLNILPRSGKKEILDTSIAVLPLVNLSSNDDISSIGFTNEIIMELQKIKAFSRVLSLTSTMQFAEHQPTSPEIGQILNVNYLIEGTIQKQHDKISIIIQVISAKEDDHIWAEEFEDDWENRFNLQDQIALVVAEELHAVITPEEKQRIEKSSTYSLDAYHLYQRGEEKYMRYVLERDTAALYEAEKLFNKALEYDSEFAPAFVSLAKVYFHRQYYPDLFSDTYLDSVYVLTEKALSIDHEIAEAYSWRGRYFTEKAEFNKAINEFEKALKYNPNDWRAYRGLGYIYWDILDDLPKAIENYHKALERDRIELLPNNIGILGSLYRDTGFKGLAEQYYKKRLNVTADSAFYYVDLAFLELTFLNFELAVELNEKAIRIDSSALSPYEFYSEVGDYQKQYEIYMELIRMLERTGRVNAFHNLHRLGYVCWMLEKHDEARAYFIQYIRYGEENIRLNRLGAYYKAPHYDLAGVYAFLGQPEKAYQHLREWNTRNSFPLWWVNLIKRDSLFESIRNEPEFQQILKDVEAKYMVTHETVKQWLEENDML